MIKSCSETTRHPRGSEILGMAVGNDGQTLDWIVKDWNFAVANFVPGYGNVLEQQYERHRRPGNQRAGTYPFSRLHPTPGVILSINPASIPKGGVKRPASHPLPGSHSARRSQVRSGHLRRPITVDRTDHGANLARRQPASAAAPRGFSYPATAATPGTWPLTAMPGAGRLNCPLGPTEYIRNLDISIDYGGKRDIGLVTTTGAGAGRWFVRSSTGFNNWLDQQF